MMRKLLIVCLCMLITTPIFADGELKGAQLQLRTDIANFLREEGFMPEIRSTGKIKFKSEGVGYFVEVDKDDESPMYVILSLDYLYSDNYTKSKVQRVIPELNLYKGCKLVCFSTIYSMRAEMFLTDSEGFKYVFYKLLHQIKSMNKELTEICNK